MTKDGLPIVHDEETFVIAEPGEDPVAWPANARLIAAAPELLKDGSALLDALIADYPDDGTEADTAPVEHFGECGETALTFGHIRRLRAAIAKARGTA
jgi:hypothetical protein